MWSLIWNRTDSEGHKKLETEEDAHSAFSMLVADLRSVYGVSFWDAGTEEMSYEEMVYLIIDLQTNTDTRFGAFKNGVSHKFTLAEFILSDIYDQIRAFGAKKGAKPKPYHMRPKLDEKDKSTSADNYGREETQLTREELLAQVNKIFRTDK